MEQSLLGCSWLESQSDLNVLNGRNYLFCFSSLPSEEKEILLHFLGLSKGSVGSDISGHPGVVGLWGWGVLWWEQGGWNKRTAGQWAGLPEEGRTLHLPGAEQGGRGERGGDAGVVVIFFNLSQWDIDGADFRGGHLGWCEMFHIPGDVNVACVPDCEMMGHPSFFRYTYPH